MKVIFFRRLELSAITLSADLFMKNESFNIDRMKCTKSQFCVSDFMTDCFHYADSISYAWSTAWLALVGGISLCNSTLTNFLSFVAFSAWAKTRCDVVDIFELLTSLHICRVLLLSHFHAASAFIWFWRLSQNETNVNCWLNRFIWLQTYVNFMFHRDFLFDRFLTPLTKITNRLDRYRRNETSFMDTNRRTLHDIEHLYFYVAQHHCYF